MTQTKRRTKNLAQTPEIDKITLADGKEYELAPLDINIMAEMEDKFDMSWDDLAKSNRVKPIRYLLLLMLRDKYPHLTEEKVGSLFNSKIATEMNKQKGAE